MPGSKPCSHRNHNLEGNCRIGGGGGGSVRSVMKEIRKVSCVQQRQSVASCRLTEKASIRTLCAFKLRLKMSKRWLGKSTEVWGGQAKGTDLAKSLSRRKCSIYRTEMHRSSSWEAVSLHGGHFFSDMCILSLGWGGLFYNVMLSSRLKRLSGTSEMKGEVLVHIMACWWLRIWHNFNENTNCNKERCQFLL